MKLVLAFEGLDGAGKSSLALHARRLCAEHGRRCTAIGRRESYANALIGRLTRVLHEDALGLSPAGETLVRMAREQERGCLAARVGPGLVVVDRFVLSALALARLHGQDVEAVTRLLREVTLRADLFATVFVSCPFEAARARVKERTQGVPLRRSRDERFLRRLGEFLDEDFRRGLLTGQQWPVDNGGRLEVAQEQLAGYLVPYLERTRPEPPTEPAAGPGAQPAEVSA